MPKIISLIAPPPTAVMTPKTMIPKISKLRLIATIAPEIANAIIPINSMIIISFPNVMTSSFLTHYNVSDFFWYNLKKHKGVYYEKQIFD